MEEKVKEILRDFTDREERASLAFFLCFNLLEDESKYTSDEIRNAFFDMLDRLCVSETYSQ